MVFAKPLSAEVYRWVDENGVTHFGSKPPPGAHDEIDISQANSIDAPQGRSTPSTDRSGQNKSYIAPPTPERSIPDYICQGATNRAISAKERWETARRQGYTQGQKQRHLQRIVDAERHRDNICR